MCGYKALKLTQTKLTSAPKTLGFQDMQFVSERAQKTKQNHKAKKGLISSLLLPLADGNSSNSAVPGRQHNRDGNTSMEWEGFQSQWSRITSIKEHNQQPSPTTATPQTLPCTLRDARRSYSWTKPTKMNNRTENILLIVNLSQVEGWKTKPWRAIMKRGKGPIPKRKGHTWSGNTDKPRTP